MVKIFLIFLLLLSSAYANKLKMDDEEPLIKKIKSLIAPASFVKDRAFIDTIFSPKEKYYADNGKIDSIKVVKTLKDNGILNLFFKQPREINVTFKTKGSPPFFIKIMSDSLQNIGYYRYITKESVLDGSEFTWKINLTSEYATDPLILNQELKKSNCEIIDIIRENDTDWAYVIDMQNAKLNVDVLEDATELSINLSLYSYWLDVSKIDKIEISSSDRNDWYPYIAYYDESLRLLKVIKMDTKKTNITLDMQKNTHYIKISDMYSLKNIKDGIVLKPTAKKTD